MSSCMGDVPLAFQAGGVCGGNGHCVNSSRTPGLLLCLCNPGYSGASDFFDNRVERLADGTWLSFSCNSSWVGTLVIWTFFLMCICVRMIQVWPMFRQIWRRHFSDPVKVKKGIWRDFPLRIITLDTFAVTIPLIITGICKLCGKTFGTDILPTVSLCAAIVFFNIGVLDLTQQEFKIFVKGTMHYKEALKARRLRNVLKACGSFFLNCVAIVPLLWSMSLDKSLGPIENHEAIVTYLRNVGTIVYALLDMLTTSMIRRRVTKLLPSNGTPEDAVSFIVKRMDTEMRTYVIFTGTVGIAYVVFAIPYFFQFQTYITGVIIGLGALRHSGNAFAHEADIRGFESKTSDRNSSKHASKIISQDHNNQQPVQGARVGSSDNNNLLIVSDADSSLAKFLQIRTSNSAAD